MWGHRKTERQGDVGREEGETERWGMGRELDCQKKKAASPLAFACNYSSNCKSTNCGQLVLARICVLFLTRTWRVVRACPLLGAVSGGGSAGAASSGLARPLRTAGVCQ